MLNNKLIDMLIYLVIIIFQAANIPMTAFCNNIKNLNSIVNYDRRWFSYSKNKYPRASRAKN